MASNFLFLQQQWPELFRLGTAAQSYAFSDPNAAIYKMGLMGEQIVSSIFSFEDLPLSPEYTQADRLRILRRENLIPRNVDDILYAIRTARNQAVHSGSCQEQDALVLLEMSWHLCVWFMELYGDPDFRAGDYIVPTRQDTLAVEDTLDAADGPLSPGILYADPQQRSDRATDASGRLTLSQAESAYLQERSVRLEISMLPVINFALQQNGVNILRSVSILNRSGEALEGLSLSISTSPAFCVPLTRQIDRISAGSTLELRDIKLSLDGNYLASLTEKVLGLVRIRLCREDRVLSEETLDMTALAFDQWHGTGYFPELLSCFVTPNHPYISQIDLQATQYLKEWTADPSLDSYQTQDPNRVLSMAAAIFQAISQEAPVYAVAPASFEATGQRIRLCDSILSQHMANCLDLSLLFCSCLEAAGLHPLLLLTKNHAFAGLWLEDLTFPEAVQDDSSLITKRLADGIGQIAVVECTLMTAGKNATFDDARNAARQLLLGEQPVEYIIDVSRARLSGVAPLPSRVQTQQGWQLITPTQNAAVQAPQKLETVRPITGQSPAVFDKKTQWERKLLDLGLRNALINLRLSRTLIPILSHCLEDLENALESGNDFTLLPKPGDFPEPDESSFEFFHELGDSAQLIQGEFRSKRLRCAMTEGALQQTVKNLYRTARTNLEENGANTLYLALGLLRWYETDRSTKPRYAPVILLPVELIRRSASQGYQLRLRDEDAQMNITMLEKLKQDFSLTVEGLDPLPTDEKGVDIRAVFTTLRKAVMDMPRWDVLESAYLGIFSFSQFVMWNDIRNRSEDLAKNKIVRSLMEGRLTWETQGMRLPKQVSEEGVLLPIRADASQLFAIRSASEGESFILHGPPGTGKSQTITGIIANTLAQGKTVLFVAEKMAALDVVRKRLEAMGIGPFCMELHSNKTRKRDVLDQLRRASQVTEEATREDYDARAQQAAQLRKELDAYAQELHGERSWGIPLYDLVDMYETEKGRQDIPPFDPQLPQTLTPEQIQQQTLVLQQLVALGKALGHPSGHPLTPVTITQYTQQLRIKAQQSGNAYLESLEHLQQAKAALGEQDDSPATLSALCATAQELKLWMHLPKAWANAEDPGTYLADVARMAQLCYSTEEKKNKLLERWEPEFLTLDGDTLHREHRSAAVKWFLPRALGLSKVNSKVRSYAEGSFQKKQVGKDLMTLSAYQKEQTAAQALLARYEQDLQGFCNRDWGKIYGYARWALESYTRLGRIPQGRELCRRLCGLQEKLEAMDQFTQTWNQVQITRKAFTELLCIQWPKQEQDVLASRKAFTESILSNLDNLKEWIAFQALCKDAQQLGLSNVVSAYLQGLPHEELEGSYRKALSLCLIQHVLEQATALNMFSGTVFNEKVHQLSQLSSRLRELSKQEIFCRLAARVPGMDREAAHSSEIGIAQRAIRSSGRGISIRSLFSQLPNLLPRLCPCMLMSPISAAQYLDPEREPFDLVVFDEASQIQTCKAVGVLARGANAVIVGDPNQMPPTTFFASSALDEENLEAEDLESILDDCLALDLPQSHLLWHYRSRHESLIAFSNSRFYENRLLTFPSANDQDRKVRLVHVDGMFQRGKRRQNLQEAEAIVAELKRRCHDTALSGQSVGVVTFNINQQNLIDDLLTEACKTDPELEQWVLQGEEPLFIKNLENVQGDERDVILFSVTYGPDEEGKVYMNFGPLNRDGGWRRLNVAVTRARHEMIVFATLTPDQINLSRTAAQGVAALKAFLEYAGGLPLPQDEKSVGFCGKSAVADAICQALESKGYQTRQAVGHSQSRVDIAVVHPQNPQQYLLGILLDGKNYGSAKTTTDRELSQISVLEGLGWKILRIWTMDWWDNPCKEICRVITALEQPQEEQQAEALPELPQVSTVSRPSLPRQIPYTPAQLPQRDVDAEALQLRQYDAALRETVFAVLLQEAPICQSLLNRRVAQSFGIARAGTRLQERLENLYRSMALKTTMDENGQTVYWYHTQDPNTYDDVRFGDKEENRREANQIPVVEAKNAVVMALSQQLALTQEDLIRESAKLLGYSRLGTAVAVLLSTGIRKAQEEGLLDTDRNGKLILK